MKKVGFFIVLIAAVILVGCEDDVASAGAGALADDEEVRVCSRTMAGMQSTTDSVGDFIITQTPDSFLLGEVNTNSWATIKAEVLTQFACPVGYVYPEGAVVDSVALAMTYSSWFAEGNSPLRISVYELDKATFDYNKVYSSKENIYDYWSGNDQTHVVKEDQIVVAAQPKDSVYSSTNSRYYPYVRFLMNDQFVAKMNELKKFPSQEEFNQYFKGLYLTTTWGASTALYVGNITMMVYYHYMYEGKQMDDVKYLYANNEVRQVNRYSFPYKDNVVQTMQAAADSINYVVSPGYVFTVLRLPMTAYVDTIFSSLTTSRGDMLQPYINKALMRVDVLNAISSNKTADKWASPASDMLLIRKDSLQAFFTTSHLPSADYCLLSSLSSTINSDYSYAYHYDFDVSTLLYNEVHKRMRGDAPADVEMVMIPVDVEYSTSSSTTVVSRVKINQTITFTAIQSAQFVANPLSIDAVYSGFTINSIH